MDISTYSNSVKHIGFCLRCVEKKCDMTIMGAFILTEKGKTMSEYPKKLRMQVYTNALTANGEKYQLTVAIEELAECQKEICKAIRGMVNEDHLAEEVADATIVLEQVRMLFGIDDKVRQIMDQKVDRLDRNLRGLN